MPSPTVALRRVRLGDAPAVLDAFADEEMSRQGDVHDEATATAYTQRLVDNPYAFAVDEGGTLIGVVAITADQENRLGWFWYWTHRAHRGRGLAGRAAATVANWALRDGGLERLELGHRVDNPASGAVARAAGFVQEGVERGKFLVDGERIDVLTYGRLRTDPWPATPGLPMDTSEDRAGRGRARVVRVIPDLPVDDLAETEDFLTGYLGMTREDLGLDWVARYTAGTGAVVQTVTRDATASDRPVLSVAVADVDAAHDEARARGYEIVHPLTTEPWGVRRFFVRTPGGHVVNVLRHRN
jgi:RimJ/RimL family protein N-acetyltransferase/catechol 2,3-dioxygenase-like lactoylglutathione lyase family enzyme